MANDYVVYWVTKTKPYCCMKSLNVKIEAIKPERKYYTETSHFDSLEPTQKLDAVLSGLSIYGKYIPDIHVPNT